MKRTKLYNALTIIFAIILIIYNTARILHIGNTYIGYNDSFKNGVIIGCYILAIIFFLLYLKNKFASKEQSA